MDLSKAFDCLNHKLLIAKLNADGFSPSALRLIHSYLSERKQRVNADQSSQDAKQSLLMNLLSFFHCRTYLYCLVTEFLVSRNPLDKPLSSMCFVVMLEFQIV